MNFLSVLVSVSAVLTGCFPFRQIPSTYGPDRLDLLRQLEKVKEMETEVNPTEKADE